MLRNVQTKPDGVRGYSERFGEGVAKRRCNIYIYISKILRFFSKIVKIDYFIIYTFQVIHAFLRSGLFLYTLFCIPDFFCIHFIGYLSLITSFAFWAIFSAVSP